jgi:putative transcriptional regulator
MTDRPEHANRRRDRANGPPARPQEIQPPMTTIQAIPETGAGERMKRAREHAGLTQQEAADRAGIHRVTLARLETDARKPSAVLALALARALDTTVENLIGGGE